MTNSTKKDFTLACLIGLGIFLFRLSLTNSTGDLTWPLCAARLFVEGKDPFGPTCLTYRQDGTAWVVNPLTTVIALIPFVKFPDFLVAPFLLGISASFLAYGLIRRGGIGMLVVFFSMPALETLKWAQWTFLIPAIAFLPFLYPLSLIKPHVALPAILTNLTKFRLGLIVAIGLFTIILKPYWILSWLRLSSSYDGYIPIFSFSGLFILSLIFCFTSKDARYGLIAGLTPQRALYDTMIVIGSLRYPYEALIWTIASWIFWKIALILRLPFIDSHVLAAYLPVVILLIFRYKIKHKIDHL